MVPFPRLRHSFQGAQSQHLIVTFRSKPGQVKVVVGSALQSRHIPIVPAVMAETGPDLHLGSVLAENSSRKSVTPRPTPLAQPP